METSFAGSFVGLFQHYYHIREFNQPLVFLGTPFPAAGLSPLKIGPTS